MDRIHLDKEKITFVSETNGKQMELICEDHKQAEGMALRLINTNVNLST